eukprot:6084850-Prymnesium_polylepis.1
MAALQRPPTAGPATCSEDGAMLPPLMRRIDAMQLLGGRHAVSWTQSQVLRVHAADPTSAAHSMPFGAWLDGPLDVQTLRTSLAEVMPRHAVLRTTFEKDAELGGFSQH